MSAYDRAYDANLAYYRRTYANLRPLSFMPTHGQDYWLEQLDELEDKIEEQQHLLASDRYGIHRNKGRRKLAALEAEHQALWERLKEAVTDADLAEQAERPSCRYCPRTISPDEAWESSMCHLCKATAEGKADGSHLDRPQPHIGSIHGRAYGDDDDPDDEERLW